MKDLVLAIDQGTTGTTVLLLDAGLKVVGKGYSEFPQIFPKPGWVEHDPEDIWHSVERVIKAALASSSINPNRIAAIGITNQRETTILWDRATGKAAHNGIVWQDRRTARTCDALRRDGAEPKVQEITGLLLDPYFSGTKVKWLLDEVKGLRARAEAGHIAFGTVDSFLAWRLSGGKIHVTDAANASRTMLMNLRTLAWDDEMLRLLSVPRAVLPEIRGNAETYGATAGLSMLPDGIPIAGMAGDQQAALFGQACFAPGQVKITYGTGAFALVNTGTACIPSRHRVLTTVAWKLGKETTYALEGSAFICGAAVQWLRDGLGLIKTSAEIEDLAAAAEDSGGVLFVPALVGMGAPHWDAGARGLILGISRGTTKAHIARATLEGMALQNHELLMAMQEDFGRPITQLKVDGGAAANNLLMQMQADVLGIEVVRPTMIETTALGAALLAGLAIGVWSDLDEVRKHWKEDRRFKPLMPRDEAARQVARWKDAVARARSGE
jgi:glycerol kinase